MVITEHQKFISVTKYLFIYRFAKYFLFLEILAIQMRLPKIKSTFRSLEHTRRSYKKKNVYSILLNTIFVKVDFQLYGQSVLPSLRKIPIKNVEASRNLFFL